MCRERRGREEKVERKRKEEERMKRFQIFLKIIEFKGLSLTIRGF